MSDSKLENDCGLIIDPALLADIQAACRQRAAELEAATSAESRLSSEQEAERFAAAVVDMPANVRRFFQHEEPAAFHQPESVENNAERRLRESFGGWCG
jgi:hypothetical protein